MRDEAALQSTLSLVIVWLENFAKRVHDRMSEVDWLMQRDLIRTLVKRVEINQDDVNVVFRIDGTLPTPDPASPGQNSFWQGCERVDEGFLLRHRERLVEPSLEADGGKRLAGQATTADGAGQGTGQDFQVIGERL